MTAMLETAFELNPRFHRSVQIARDWTEPHNLDGYIVTANVLKLTRDILANFSQPRGTRAWSITGPYGSGKSAFTLFLADTMGRSEPGTTGGRALLHDSLFKVNPLLPVFIVGSREPLKNALLNTVALTFEHLDVALSIEAKALLVSGADDQTVVSLLERGAKTAERAGHGGLLIAIDEFGKFLEYASRNPQHEDLFLVQHLAEMAARSEARILLVTVLHSAFSSYLDARDLVRQAEWQKVQGRFVDVPFSEPPEHFLRLVSQAVHLGHSPELAQAYATAISRSLGSNVLREAFERHRVADVLPACPPLEPITALMLYPVFRSKLAQNERSLFAFLTSHEPHGLREFLEQQRFDGEHAPFYRLDRLYDYVTAALGASTYRGEHARRWLEIDRAVQRVNQDAPPLTEAVVKAIGLIQAYGMTVGLRSTHELIEVAFDDAAAVQAALGYLERFSIVVFRRFDKTYALWEGSDIDLERSYLMAKEHIGRSGLADRLRLVVELRAIAARAHYIETGTLRLFAMHIIGAKDEELKNLLSTPEPSTGRVIFVITGNPKERQALLEKAKRITKDAPLNLIAFPEPMSGLLDALEDVESWTWVAQNTPGIQGDPVARRELGVRRDHARERLEAITGEVLGLQGHRFMPNLSQWIQGGKVINLETPRRFLSTLSTLCNEAFNDSPKLLNELLNRQTISTAAAQARRLLILAMLERADQPQLGIEGAPPELSMYRTMLLEGGFHVEHQGSWRLQEPKEGSTWHAVWKEIRAFLESTRKSRLSLSVLYDRLKAIPYGLLDGPLPILVAVALVVFKDRLALYENGAFIPEIRIEVLERLLRGPERFELHELFFSKRVQQALRALSQNIDGLREDDSDRKTLLEITRSLIMVVRDLPKFTQQTRRLEPPSAVAMRDEIMRATDPVELLFKTLPAIFGEPTTDEGPSDPIRFATQVQAATRGLQLAHPNLLDTIEHHLREVFDLRGSSDEARQALRMQALPLRELAVDSTVISFVNEACRDDSRDWREGLGRAVANGSPPLNWRDQDVDSFLARLLPIAASFHRLEEFAAERRISQNTRVLRIGILEDGLNEASTMIRVTPEEDASVQALSERLYAALGTGNERHPDRRTELAALTDLASRLLKEHPLERD